MYAMTAVLPPTTPSGLHGGFTVPTRALLSTTAYAQPVETPPVTPSPPVDAQPPAARPSPAMVAFEEGRALLEAGKYEEACAKFTASITDDPDAPGTLLNLGLCNEKLGRTATALAWYRKAQFRSAEARKSADEDAAKQRTIELAACDPGVEAKTDSSATVERLLVVPASRLVIAAELMDQLNIGFDKAWCVADGAVDALSPEDLAATELDPAAQQQVFDTMSACGVRPG